jgi:hypothetical protein
VVWLTTGVQSQETEKDNWVDVSSIVTTVKTQLALDRELPFQVGFYSRCRTAIVRYLSASQSTKFALQSLIGLACRIHRFDRIILWACISPSHGHDAANLWPSIERQVEFSRAVIPRNIPFIVHRANLVYAYSLDATERLETLFKEDTTERKTLLLTTSLDRLIRRKDYFQELDTTLQCHRCSVISLLWDTETMVPTRETQAWKYG